MELQILMAKMFNLSTSLREANPNKIKCIYIIGNFNVFEEKRFKEKFKEKYRLKYYYMVE